MKTYIIRIFRTKFYFINIWDQSISTKIILLSGYKRSDVTFLLSSWSWMIFERIWAGKGKRRRCKETASIEGGQFFDNCSVKTGEAAANRRQSRPDTIFAFVFNPCIAPRQFRLRGPMGHNGGLTKGWSGPPLINRGLQGKSDSCAGFYREDEWVNREMAYESGVAGDATRNKSRFFPIQQEGKNKNNGIEDTFPACLGFRANSPVTRSIHAPFLSITK